MSGTQKKASASESRESRDNKIKMRRIIDHLFHDPSMSVDTISIRRVKVSNTHNKGTTETARTKIMIEVTDLEWENKDDRREESSDS